MKIDQIVTESTTAGSIAPVAAPLAPKAPGGSKVRRRAPATKAGSLFKGKTTNKPFYEDKVDEAKLDEEDKILAPGKGSRTKSGLISKEKHGALAKFRIPFKASGRWVSDSRGNNVCECEDEGVAPEIAKALNQHVKISEIVQPGGVVAGGGVGEE